MHIIFGKPAADELQNKYTVLELETFRVNGTNLTAYCVVEEIPFDEIASIDTYRSLHQKLIENYYGRDWNFCEQAIDHLHGKFGKELDSFYLDFLTKVHDYMQNDPGEEWTGIVSK
jgi:hypothetical protein